MEKYFEESVKESCGVKEKSFVLNKAALMKITGEIFSVFSSEKKILIFGNGGSAADAQHVAAEFVVRLKIDRKAYPVMALTTDTSVLTACGNDLGYKNVFSRQVEAFGNPGDLAVALSTSGNSENIIEAVSAAKKAGLKVIGFTGKNGGKLKGLCDILISVDSENTMRIQETYMAFLHIICDITEQKLQGIKNG